MSDPVSPLNQRDADQAAFNRARDQFKACYASVSDAALTYLPDGDDYALGGLVVHVANAIDHYVHVLEMVRGARFGSVRAAEGSGENAEMQERLRHGFDGAHRSAEFARMDASHAALVAEISSFSEEEYLRKAPIIFGSSGDPLDTSAHDIMGWMTGHYHEHVDQVGAMLADWTHRQS